MYVCLVAWCNSNPMAASRAHPPEVPSVAGNTQADDTLPSVVGRGGANCRITPRPHTQLFGGARHPPPPGNRAPTRTTPSQNPTPSQTPPLPAPPPPQGASSRQLVGGVVGVQNRGVAPPPGLDVAEPPTRGVVKKPEFFFLLMSAPNDRHAGWARQYRAWTQHRTGQPDEVWAIHWHSIHGAQACLPQCASVVDVDWRQGGRSGGKKAFIAPS